MSNICILTDDHLRAIRRLTIIRRKLNLKEWGASKFDSALGWAIDKKRYTCVDLLTEWIKEASS